MIAILLLPTNIYLKTLVNITKKKKTSDKLKINK